MHNKTQPNYPKLAIVGRGAIGGLIGFKCHQLGYDYQHLIKTQQQPRSEVTDIAGVKHNFIPITSIVTKPNQFDLLILPVKAYQIMLVLKKLELFIQPNHIIVLLHNGMGTIDQVKEKLPNNPLIAATTSYGAYKLDSNTLIETGLGQTHLGWLTPCDKSSQQTIEILLSSLLPPSIWHHDIDLALWKKLAINAVINPLTAIHKIKNGQLSSSQYQSDVLEICTEIAKVMTASGYVTGTSELIRNVKHVIDATANNYSSMHQDITFNRQTEIEFINGYVVNIAKKLKLSVPLNEQLVMQINAIGNNNKG